MNRPVARPSAVRPPLGNASAPVRAPLRVVTLPPSAFADTWKDRPREPVRVGLRLVGEDVVEEAQNLACEEADDTLAAEVGGERQTIWLDAFNSAVMRHVLAHALCAPDDASRAYFTSAPNDAIRVALRPATLRRLWEELEILSIETSPASPLATDDEISSLGNWLAMPDLLNGIPEAEAKRLRRLLARVRGDLLAAMPNE